MATLKRLLILLVLFALGVMAQSYDWRTGFMFYAQNDSVVGTIQYHNVKSTGDNPSKVIRTSTADAMAESGTIGIAVLNSGTSPRGLRTALTDAAIVEAAGWGFALDERDIIVPQFEWGRDSDGPRYRRDD